MSTGQRLAQLAHELQRRNDPQAVMEHIVTAAVALVPGVQDATITRVRARRHVFSQASAGPLGTLLDQLQDQTGEGPCLDALYEDQTVRVADLATDPRWPRLAQHAGQAGLRSVLCFQLFVEGDNLGSLDLIATTPDVLDDDAEDVGQLFAAHAAIALAGAEELSHVQIALVSRDVIGQAKGILMERYRLDADQAFALLARVSQDANRKLREVAEELATTGQLHR
ncbi:GAF and ANTAR domain-containing protein [Kineococcus radiotolerans]|uniref:GAF and ANTAR domain-containing protein n=1 Tax=Kineococcus radiotolerans TaxID=131568 RepID=UPI00003A3EA0|nr:GAF and ANTAR domain-containing protein [Kineococcus radiotolerans]